MTEPLPIDISGRTIVRILAVLAGVWLWLHLWEWVLLLVVASFLAVGLDPVITWLDAHHVRRRFAAPVLVLAIVVAGAVFVYLASAALNEQASLLGGRVDDVRHAIVERMPPYESACQGRPSAESGRNNIWSFEIFLYLTSASVTSST